MKNLNTVSIEGNIGQDPELKPLESGVSLGKFSVAVNDDYKDKSGNKVEQVDWIPVQVWGKTAEYCSKYLKKGDRVIVNGKLKTYSFTTKEGETKKGFMVKANQYDGVFIRNGGSVGGNQNQGSQPGYSAGGQSSQFKDGVYQPDSGGGFDDNFGGDDMPF